MSDGRCHSKSVLASVTGVLALMFVKSVAIAQLCGSAVDSGFEAHAWTESTAVDCAIAVGDPGILVTTNDGLWLFDREGNELDDHTLHADFFGEFGAVDTVCVFDRLTSRYFILTI